MGIASQILEMMGATAQIPSLAREFSEDEQKSIYSSAFQHYALNQFDKAIPLFSQLTMIAPLQIAYWQGLASCYQMQGLYDLALHSWAMCSLLDSADPVAHYHAGECLFAKEDHHEALKAINLCLLASSDANLTQKAQRLKALCNTTAKPN
jgi:type III secretion system low calcium response chaperone LcrH/SycD